MKCEKCGAENPDMAKYCEKCGSPIAITRNMTLMVDRYAHYANYSPVESDEEKRMEDYLLSCGPEAADVIVDYLILCGQGAPTIESYWWNNAASLVRLIKEFPDIDHESRYRRLISLDTNIWEYHTQIKQPAQEELQSLKSESGGSKISAADADMELQVMWNRLHGMEAIEKAKAMENSVDGWSDESKAFYYYIIGHVLKFDFKMEGETPYAYYAAQLYYNPANTSLGWLEIRKLDEFSDLKPSKENAQMLHERFPLPESLNDLKL